MALKKIKKKGYLKLQKAIRHPLNRLKVAIKRKLGWLGIPLVQVFNGFGTVNLVVVHGRVIEDHGILQPNPHDSVWRNMLAMFKRYASSGLPDIHVQVVFGQQVQETRTDDSGFFEVCFELPEPLPDQTCWKEATVRLMSYTGSTRQHAAQLAKGEVLIIGKGPQYGIISDIDDTFLVSYSTDLIRKIRLMALKNAHTRLPFDGVAAFYQALAQGKNGRQQNPFFYVSSSEWHLYDLLDDFCRFQQIPKGIFLLRYMQTSILKPWKAQKVNHDHKFQKIKKILKTFQQLPFILIGDSGQKDMEIYMEVIKKFPKRVVAVYIRNVSKKKRHLQVLKMAHLLETVYKVPVMLVQDTEAAARHALASDYINQQAFLRTVDEIYVNQSLPTDLEELFRRHEDRKV